MTFTACRCLPVFVLTIALAACRQGGTTPYKNAALPPEQRVNDLLGRMTLEEKAGLLAGTGWMETRAIERLGIPSIKMADGPMGVRYWSFDLNPTTGRFGATAFPAGVAMAATWDVALVEREGKAIGEQIRALGRDMILGPTVNIARIPHWGRNFEAYGEDPYLAARLAVAYVRGVQSTGTIATVKHFAANNQEFERNRVDVRVSRRALHEIYFPAFRAAVQEAGAGAVMSAYNKVNGAWCAENPYLLTEVLRRQWGFKGFVVSDWASTHTTAESINAGLDLEMPGGETMQKFLQMPDFTKLGFTGGFLTPERVLAAVRDGRVTEAVIDERVRSLLHTMFTLGLFDRTPPAQPLEIDTPEQRGVAREAALASIVLLKNNGSVLPLSPDTIRSIAVIGPNAAVARTGGGGSSRVTPKRPPQTPLDAIREAAGSRVKVMYALGCSMEGEDKAKDTPQARSALRKEAVELAASSDVALVFAGYSPETETEMSDRKLELPGGQEDLIRAVAQANKRTVVVLYAGGPVMMERWVTQAPALLMAWYPGQETGAPIAAVLFGLATPSGKLPVTFPRRWQDSPAYGNYPGRDLTVNYAEGIYVGYRHFDTRNVEPLFPFGHGLSYTTFAYGDLSITPGKVSRGGTVQVTASVRNTGTRRGAEVVQLYLRDIASTVDRPARELKGFAKVTLDPGEAKTVSFTLDQAAMSFYSEAQDRWVAEPGLFEVQIGASSRDIRLKGTFELVE